MKTILSIAGSDSCGGAGIQADLKASAGMGVYCATVITAVTAQNPSGVRAFDYVGDELLRQQLDAVFESMQPDAVKIGMIPNAAAARIIADALRKYKAKNVVVDPVLVATSGSNLTVTEKDAFKKLLRAFREELHPLATVVTPNLPELFGLLLEEESEDIDAAALRYLNLYGTENLLVKGGHGTGDECVDYLYSVAEKGEDVMRTDYHSGRIETRHTHGTGCTLSTAIASQLALGYTLSEAVRGAKEFVYTAILRGRENPVFPDNGPLIPFEPA